jgi:hypothetical protein
MLVKQSAGNEYTQHVMVGETEEEEQQFTARRSMVENVAIFTVVRAWEDNVFYGGTRETHLVVLVEGDERTLCLFSRIKLTRRHHEKYLKEGVLQI